MGMIGVDYPLIWPYFLEGWALGGHPWISMFVHSILSGKCPPFSITRNPKKHILEKNHIVRNL